MGWWKSSPENHISRAWQVCAAGLFPIVYMLVAMHSNLNLGIRHLLPIYPFLFIFIGVAAARSAKRFGSAAKWVMLILLLSLAVESLSAFPNYISFFNPVVGGARGGLALLGDSNIDWGQELPALADWQRNHPGTFIDLCYFGPVDPKYFGIRYANLPGSMAPLSDSVRGPNEIEIIAISAPMMQGAGLPAAQRQLYAPLLLEKPIDVIDESIYLFEARGGIHP